MPGRMLIVVLLGTAAIACGGPSKMPARSSAPSDSALLPQEEDALARAVAFKRAGDPTAGWMLLEALPASSPARFDPRYTEVMSAWADARTRQLGTEIAGSKGGGPPPTAKIEADEPPRTLTADAIEDIVASKRSKLRDACFGQAKATSFTLDLNIDPEGTVLAATTSAVKGDGLVAECVRGHAQAWKFPKNLEGAQHKTRFMFAR